MTEIISDSITVDPQRWGPHFWGAIDAIAVVFDPNDSQSREFTLLFFHSLQGVIPCFQCRNHYCLYFRDHPLQDALHSKSDLMEWILRLKNAIQERLGGRPTFTMLDYLRNTESKFHIAVTVHPSLAVVVSVTPEEAEKVPQCLQGLLEQTLLPSLVLLCFSEREEDNLGALLQTSFPDLSLVVLTTPDSQTPSENKNRGIEYCVDKKNTDAVVFLRTTDRLHPQKIWQMRQALLQYPKASVIVHPSAHRPTSFSNIVLPDTAVTTEPLSSQSRSLSVNHSQLLLHLNVCSEIRFHRARAENDLVRRVETQYGRARYLPHTLSCPHN